MAHCSRCLPLKEALSDPDVGDVILSVCALVKTAKVIEPHISRAEAGSIQLEWNMYDDDGALDVALELEFLRDGSISWLKCPACAYETWTEGNNATMGEVGELINWLSLWAAR